MAAQEVALSERLLSYLRDRNDVRILGRRDSAAASRAPTISFKVGGRDSSEIVRAVDEAGIGMRVGDLHSKRLVEMLGDAEGRRRIATSFPPSPRLSVACFRRGTIWSLAT